MVEAEEEEVEGVEEEVGSMGGLKEGKRYKRIMPVLKRIGKMVCQHPPRQFASYQEHLSKLEAAIRVGDRNTTTATTHNTVSELSDSSHSLEPESSASSQDLRLESLASSQKSQPKTFGFSQDLDAESLASYQNLDESLESYQNLDQESLESYQNLDQESLGSSQNLDAEVSRYHRTEDDDVDVGTMSLLSESVLSLSLTSEEELEM